jgi:NADPH:quinone reductase-like Zn-dependent oxidoreductase
MVAAVRVPVLELPPPRSVQFCLRGVGRDAQNEVVVRQGTPIVRRGVYLRRRTRNRDVKAQSPMATGACGKPVAKGIMVMQTATSSEPSLRWEAQMKYTHVVVDRTGGPEVMKLVDDELPVPGPGQVRVKVLAADVSFSDVNVRRGRYPGGPKPPFTPGYAMVGVVDQVGPEVSSPAPGERVAALTFYGSYSQFISLPATELVRVPTRVDPAEAVSLVLNYVAAYQMLHRVANVTGGQRILVHGAAGGVGTAFLELAQLAGLETYGTASKPKLGLIARLGATPIDYRTEDFVKRIATLTNGSGVDAVFDPIGSAHLRLSVRAVRKGGTVVAYGFYEAAKRGSNILLDVLSQYVWLTVWSMPPSRKHVAFYDIRSTKRKHPDWFSQDLTALLGWLAAGKLRPVIAARLPLGDVVRAHRQVEAAGVEGKLILIPNPREGVN